MQKGKCEIVEGEKSNEKYQTFLEPTFVMKNMNNKANIKKCLLKALTFLQYLVFGSSHLCYRNNLKMVKKGTCLTSKVAPLSKLIKGSYHKHLYLF